MYIPCSKFCLELFCNTALLICDILGFLLFKPSYFNGKVSCVSEGLSIAFIYVMICYRDHEVWSTAVIWI